MPLLLLLVPLSIVLAATPIRFIRHLAPFPIHPDLLPPRQPWGLSLFRNYLLYVMSGVVWSLTCIDAPPAASEEDVKKVVFGYVGVYDRVARWAERAQGRGRADKEGTKGKREGRLAVKEVRLKKLDERYMLGVLRDTWEEEREYEAGKKGPLGFWLTHNALPPLTVRSSVKTETAPDIVSEKANQEDQASLGDHKRSHTAEECEQGINADSSSSINISPDSHLSSSKRQPQPSASIKVDRKVYLFTSGG